MVDQAISNWTRLFVRVNVISLEVLSPAWLTYFSGSLVSSQIQNQVAEADATNGGTVSCLPVVASIS